MPDESREAVSKSWLGQHGATVLNVARATTRMAEDCQDLAQEILLQVWPAAGAMPTALRGHGKHSQTTVTSAARQ